MREALWGVYTIQQTSSKLPAKNREKFTKTPYFGSSRSFKVIDVDISKKLVVIFLLEFSCRPIPRGYDVMISGMSVPIYATIFTLDEPIAVE